MNEKNFKKTSVECRSMELEMMRNMQSTGLPELEQEGAGRKRNQWERVDKEIEYYLEEIREYNGGNV